MLGKIPIIESAGEAVRFLRVNWRLALIVGGAGAGAQTVALVALGQVPLLWYAGAALIASAIHAAYVGAALDGANQARARLARDTVRVFGAMAIMGVFVGMIAMVLFFGALTILFGPYTSEIQAAGENQQAVLALMQRVMNERPVLTALLGAAMTLMWLMATSRFYAAAPASVERGRLVVFDSWAWTKGRMWSILAARLCVLGPAFVLVNALAALVGRLLGVPGDNLVAAAQTAQSAPGAFLVFVLGTQFVQIALYCAFEAGLAVRIYRALAPAPDTRRA